uniref:Uncharacterized protein n=1 Tax=Anguilla anguilla TaxID=7936 RepID=A0A0E9TRH7_ANGAN
MPQCGMIYLLTKLMKYFFFFEDKKCKMKCMKVWLFI